MNLLRIFERHPRADLSAYTDGQLSPDKGERLERHLESCAACSRELASIRALSSALRDLPQAEAPRSFALRPSQVAAPSKKQKERALPVFIAMRVAGTGVAAALAVIVLVDSGGVTTDSDDSAAPAGQRAGLDEPVGGDTTLGMEVLDGTAQDDSFNVGEDGDDSADDGAAPDDASGAAGGGPPPADPAGDNDRDQDTDLDVPLEGDDSTGEGDDSESATITSGSPANEGDGLSTTTILQLALGALAVLAIGGSFVLPRIVRRDN